MINFKESNRNSKKIAPFFVTIGAISYGIPASLFKLAGKNGLNQSTILISTMFLSSLFLTILYKLKKNRKDNITKSRFGKIFISGFSLAGTNIFYIFSLSQIPVAIAAVLLMQSVWITMILNSCIKKVALKKTQIIQIAFILLGTFLATDVLSNLYTLSVLGIALGLLAAICYSITLTVTGNIQNDVDPILNSAIMSYGALFITILVFHNNFQLKESFVSLFKWGGEITIFSMIIPLLSYSYFMPKLSIGIGPIISSLELPASIITSYILLKEQVKPIQIFGVLIILFTVLIANMRVKEIE